MPASGLPSELIVRVQFSRWLWKRPGDSDPTPSPVTGHLSPALDSASRLPHDAPSSTTPTGDLVKTHLYDEHVKLKAKIVDFHGWDMPIQYSNIIEEHTAVRKQVGLFDLSHMGRIWVRGQDRKAWLDRMLTIDIPKMAPGRVRYTFLLTAKGSVIDDLLVYEDA